MKNRIDIMKEKLTLALTPTHLAVMDDSAEHVGHAGAAGGAGHYTVVVASKLFEGKTTIKTHQMVYAALDGMIGPEIHALRIIIKTI